MTKLQPWIAYIALVISLWPAVLWVIRRLFYKGRLELYPTSDVMLGFTDDGPSLVISGTIRALNQEMFVESMYADVYFPDDGAVRPFIWRHFVPDDPSLSGLRRARGFDIAKSSTSGFNLCFVDAYAADEIRDLVTCARDAFQLHAHSARVFAAAARVDWATDDSLKLLFEDESFLHAVTTMQNDICWVPGEYRLVISAVLPSGKRFDVDRHFTLTEADVAALRLDHARMAHQIVDGESVLMNWRTVRLVDPFHSLVFD